MRHSLHIVREETKAGSNLENKLFSLLQMEIVFLYVKQTEINVILSKKLLMYFKVSVVREQ